MGTDSTVALRLTALAQDISGTGFSPVPEMGATGREQTAKTPVKSTIPKTGDALSGALSGNSEPSLPELIQRLSELTPADKAKLAAMLKDNGKEGQK